MTLNWETACLTINIVYIYIHFDQNVNVITWKTKYIIITIHFKLISRVTSWVVVKCYGIQEDRQPDINNVVVL